MDKEAWAYQSAELFISSFPHWREENIVLNYGCIISCEEGDATFEVNFDTWTFQQRSVLILFPGDMVMIKSATPHFKAQVLRYDVSLLREASLQLEQTVYSLLRKDRCRGVSPLVTDIIKRMFALLQLFYEEPGCECFDQLVLLQLKAFFLGFQDYLKRNPLETPPEEGSVRVNELFSMFMEEVTKHYKECREVSYYAQCLHITPKYLSTITFAKTKHSPKSIIDHYVIMQLKLLLRSSQNSIKQIAWEYHFNDDSFFCRYFKAHTGISPQMFRKGIP